MPRIFITSGTSYTLPADFNPGNNTIECYGGGAPGYFSTYQIGGGGGAYAAVNNLNIAAGTNVSIHVGSSGATDTYFNATSLANAVSNGVAVSVGAQGANQQTAGTAASSCGTTKFSGGNGGGGGGYGAGGGGGGAAGPNGPGAHGGNGGTVGTAGGGGGGANNGSAGQTDSATAAGDGGNGRGGTGGGVHGAHPGGDATAGLGGGGGGTASGTGFRGGFGALDDVYGDGIHGPGGGGGGGGFPGYPSTANGSGGGNGGGFGAGGGSNGNYGSPGGSQTDGLIVITYVSVATSVRGASVAPILTLRAPSIIAARALRSADTPPPKMDWWRQPIDRSQPPPGKILFRAISIAPNDSPNPTPLIKLPFAQPQQNMVRNRPTLDQRQQFPGKKPLDLFGNIREGPDTVSTGAFPINVNDPVTAALIQYDAVVSIVTPAPELGGADDIIRRVKLLLPKGWWNDVAPIRDAIIGGVADVAAWSYGLVAYAKKQTRVAWATDFWLDIISKDYFRFELSRKVNETDEKFRLRIQKELIRERVTRQGMIDALTDLTGKVPYVFEPWNPGDAGAWDVGAFAWDIAGGWGDTCLPAQSFVNVIPPGAGIPGATGWDCAAMGWDVGGMWGDMSLIAGSITDADIYATINKTRPTGAIVWTQLSAPQGPLSLPVTKTRTPSFAPPAMISLVVQPGPQRYSIPVMPDSV